MRTHVYRIMPVSTLSIVLGAFILSLAQGFREYYVHENTICCYNFKSIIIGIPMNCGT